MGVDVGKVNSWSEYSIDDQGDAVGRLLKVTAVQSKPDAVIENKAQLMGEPEYGAVKTPARLAILNSNTNAEPLADLAANFRARLPASPNAQITTTPVRYHLDTDLFTAFEPDQVQPYKAQLIAEARWRLPNDGGRYTIRFNYRDVPEMFDFSAEMRSNWNGRNNSLGAETNDNWFIDFDMDGETMTRATEVVRAHFPGFTPEQKQDAIESLRAGVRGNFGGYDYSKASAWWEANGWFVHRFHREGDFKLHAELARVLLDVLVVSLMDRRVVRVITHRPKTSKKWKASGLVDPEQDVHEITIYCPGRVTGGDGTGTHASPRMHWRRGHNRTLTKGRDMPLVVPIAPV
jgi:hypothetical protein